VGYDSQHTKEQDLEKHFDPFFSFYFLFFFYFIVRFGRIVEIKMKETFAFIKFVMVFLNVFIFLDLKNWKMQNERRKLWTEG
jgi:hypothetical protein